MCLYDNSGEDKETNPYVSVKIYTLYPSGRTVKYGDETASDTECESDKEKACATLKKAVDIGATGFESYTVDI